MFKLLIYYSCKQVVARKTVRSSCSRPLLLVTQKKLPKPEKNNRKKSVLKMCEREREYSKVEREYNKNRESEKERESIKKQRESITKSKYVLYWKLYSPDFRPSWGFFKACPVALTDFYIYIIYMLIGGMI